MLANGLLALLALVQSEDAFLSWGWRIPFLLSAVLVLIGLFIRLSIEESPVFREAQARTEAATAGGEKQAMPIVEVFRNPTTGVQTLDGQMIDKPHLRAAERILARASGPG